MLLMIVNKILIYKYFNHQQIRQQTINNHEMVGVVLLQF